MVTSLQNKVIAMLSCGDTCTVAVSQGKSVESYTMLTLVISVIGYSAEHLNNLICHSNTGPLQLNGLDAL